MRPGPRPRPRTFALSAAAAALVVPTMAGCGGSNGAHDCASVAAAVTSQVNALRTAVGKSGTGPHDAATAIRAIQQDLDDIAGKTTNAASTKAVADLSQSVSNAKDALDKGDRVDVAPIAAAATTLATSCRKG